MIQYLAKKYRYKKLKHHEESLKRQFRWGEDFCSSDMYPDQLSQFQNIRINNTTGDPNRIIFGNNCNISCNVTLNQNGSINVGDNVFMNFVKMRIDHNLRIGSFCLFGPNVLLWDTDNHPLSVSERHRHAEEIPGHFPLTKSYEAGGGDIIIEDDVWIGMDALVLGGIRIGRGAVVAARSVVTKDVEPFTIVAGVPAKKIGLVPD